MIPRSRPVPIHTSEPKTPDPTFAPPPETVTLTDIDIEFASGSKYTLTLGPDDVLDGDEQQIRVKFAASGEQIEMRRDQIGFMATRQRTIPKQPAPFKPSTTEPAHAARTN